MTYIDLRFVRLDAVFTNAADSIHPQTSMIRKMWRFYHDFFFN